MTCDCQISGVLPVSRSFLRVPTMTGLMICQVLPAVLFSDIGRCRVIGGEIRTGCDMDAQSVNSFPRAGPRWT